MASRSVQLYVGMTNNLRRRVEEHKAHLPAATRRVTTSTGWSASSASSTCTSRSRETELKDWNRGQKARADHGREIQLGSTCPNHGKDADPPLRYGTPKGAKESTLRPHCSQPRYPGVRPIPLLQQVRQVVIGVPSRPDKTEITAPQLDLRRPRSLTRSKFLQIFAWDRGPCSGVTTPKTLKRRPLASIHFEPATMSSVARFYCFTVSIRLSSAMRSTSLL